MKNKNQLHRIAISAHNENIMKEYKEAKKMLHSALKNAGISYFGNQLEINEGDSSNT